MVTRAEGAVMRMTYEKYQSRRKVEPGDLDMLDRLAEAARIQLSYETDGIYAQVVRLRGHRSGCGVTVSMTRSEWNQHLFHGERLSHANGNPVPASQALLILVGVPDRHLRDRRSPRPEQIGGHGRVRQQMQGLHEAAVLRFAHEDGPVSA